MNRTRRRILGGLASAGLLAAPLVRAQDRKVAHLVIADNIPQRPRETLRAILAKEGVVRAVVCGAVICVVCMSICVSIRGSVDTR